VSATEDKIAEFLNKGGTIKRIESSYRDFRKRETIEKKLCQKCKIEPASKRFSDEDGNKYHWCEDCYEQ